MTELNDHILHLKEESQELCNRREAMLHQRVERKKRGYGIGIALLLTGFFAVRTGNSLIGLAILMAGILTVSYIRRKDKSVLVDIRELQAKIDVLKGRIEDHVFQSGSS